MRDWKFRLIDGRNLFLKVRKDDDGATMVEYSLLIGLITVVILALILSIGGFLTNQWSSLNNAITST